MNMKKEIEAYGIEEVKYQMEDEHATYFTGERSGQAVEVKIVSEDGEVAERYEGGEDWYTIGFIGE